MLSKLAETSNILLKKLNDSLPPNGNAICTAPNSFSTNVQLLFPPTSTTTLNQQKIIKIEDQNTQNSIKVESSSSSSPNPAQNGTNDNSNSNGGGKNGDDDKNQKKFSTNEGSSKKKFFSSFFFYQVLIQYSTLSGFVKKSFF